jgi:hypothetical protein
VLLSLLACWQRPLWRSTGSPIPVSIMRAAQPFALTRPEIPTPPRKTTWPGVAGERGAAGMTDQIRIAHAAGFRKDRLSSRGQATTCLVESEKRRPQGRVLFVAQPQSMIGRIYSDFPRTHALGASAQKWRALRRNRQVFRVAKAIFAV